MSIKHLTVVQMNRHTTIAFRILTQKPISALIYNAIQYTRARK